MTKCCLVLPQVWPTIACGYEIYDCNSDLMYQYKCGRLNCSGFRLPVCPQRSAAPQAAVAATPLVAWALAGGQRQQCSHKSHQVTPAALASHVQGMSRAPQEPPRSRRPLFMLRRSGCTEPWRLSAHGTSCCPGHHAANGVSTAVGMLLGGLHKGATPQVPHRGTWRSFARLPVIASSASLTDRTESSSCAAARHRRHRPDPSQAHQRRPSAAGAAARAEAA